MVHFCLTAGQAHDCPQAERLLETIYAELRRIVLADKAFDSDGLIAATR